MLQFRKTRRGERSTAALWMPVAVALLVLGLHGLALPQVQGAAPLAAHLAAPVTAPLTAPVAAPQAAQAAAAPAAAQPADLEAAMDALKARMKALGSALGASNSEAALAAVTEMQQLVIGCKQFPPSNLSQIAAADRPAHLIAYRKSLLSVLGELVNVELEVLDGKHEAALARLKGPLSDLRDDAHDKFQPKPERR